MFRIGQLLLIAMLVGCPHLCGQMANWSHTATGGGTAKIACCCSKCAGSATSENRGGNRGKVPAGPGRSNCLCCGAVMDASRVLDAQALDHSPQSWLIAYPEPIAKLAMVASHAEQSRAGFFPPAGRELCLQLCALLI